jgi:hypothetical protein
MRASAGAAVDAYAGLSVGEFLAQAGPPVTPEITCALL